MTIEVALLISIVSVAFGVWSAINNNKRNQETETKKDASEMTTVIVKLENINTGVTEIKSELSNVKQDIKDYNVRITRCEESLKSAWKRIDIIEGTDKVGKLNE